MADSICHRGPDEGYFLINTKTDAYHLTARADSVAEIRNSQPHEKNA